MQSQHEDNDFEKALEEKKQAALKGNVEAQMEMGNLYNPHLRDDSPEDKARSLFLKEEYIEKDGKEALKWYTLAAEQKNPHASYEIGLILTHGFDLEKSEFDSGIENLMIAAENNIADAQYELAINFAKVNNAVKSLQWMRLAAKNNATTFSSQEYISKNERSSLNYIEGIKRLIDTPGSNFDLDPQYLPIMRILFKVEKELEIQLSPPGEWAEDKENNMSPLHIASPAGIEALEMGPYLMDLSRIEFYQKIEEVFEKGLLGISADGKKALKFNDARAKLISDAVIESPVEINNEEVRNKKSKNTRISSHFKFSGEDIRKSSNLPDRYFSDGYILKEDPDDAKLSNLSQLRKHIKETEEKEAKQDSNNDAITPEDSVVSDAMRQKK